jgi:5-(carboxyamino)imidazole ribonucleotide synthase
MSGTRVEPRGHTLGIIGSGQLGRMLALAALPLGVHCRFLARGDADAVANFSGTVSVAPASDPRAAERAFAQGLTALTTEIENVDAATLARLAEAEPGCALWPPAAAIACKRDRREERALLARLGLPQGAWAATPDVDPGAARETLRRGLEAAVAAVGTPCRVKAAVGGYDGRGQWRVAAAADIDAVDLAAAPFVVEAEVPFDEEFSLLGTFAGDGSAPRCWAPTVNRHADGMLVRSEVAEGRIPLALQLAAEDVLTRLGHALGYRGVLALELYRVGNAVLINEFAPRVHNSGHWTIEGASCSQFENHVRAVLGLPLGDTRLRAPCVSWNVVGRWPDRAALLRIPDLHVHDYVKAPRAGRKLGHLTLWDARPDDGRARAVEALLAAAADG